MKVIFVNAKCMSIKKAQIRRSINEFPNLYWTSFVLLEQLVFKFRIRIWNYGLYIKSHEIGLSANLFRVSDTWILNFKRKNNIVLKKVTKFVIVRSRKKIDKITEEAVSLETIPIVKFNPHFLIRRYSILTQVESIRVAHRTYAIILQ